MMERAQQEFKVQVTQMRISKPFIKVFVRRLDGPDSEKLGSLKELFQKMKVQPFNPGDKCIMRMNAKRFERCQFIQLQGNKAYVFLDDCGCNGLIDVGEVRKLGHLAQIEK